MSMKGKVGVVTGGAQGLGKGFSELLLKKGAKVCIADIKVQTGEATVYAFQQQYGADSAIFVRCDVTDEADVKGVFETVKRRYGRVDVVVNDAGISMEGQWSKMVDINLKGVILGTHYGVSMMRKDEGGHGGVIINIASTAGLIPVFTTPVYVATKYGVVGYTRSWGNNPSLQEQGVRFACLCPSFTNTAILKKELYQEDELHQKNEQRTKGAEIMIGAVGIMEVGQVVAAFEELLEMPDNNGVVMAVTKHKGVKIMHRSSRL